MKETLPALPTTRTLSKLHKELLHWYDRHKRALPWRDSGNAYYVWISEIMLQQTRMEAVIPYFHKFIDKFPTIEQLAQANEDDVTKLWAGLGYYSRARNLRKAAIEIQNKHSGNLPTNYAELIALPGIGPYTANAILSMAFAQKFAAVDGNLERVIARLVAMPLSPKQGEGKSYVKEFAQMIVERGRPGDINQAFMDLSSSLCLPKTPKCLICPLAKICRANQEGLSDRIPVKNEKEKPIERAAYATILFNKSGSKFLVGKRKKKMWLAEMWDIPWQVDKKIPRIRLESKTHKKSQFQLLRSITKYRVTMHFSVCSLRKQPNKADTIYQSLFSQEDWQPIENLDLLPRVSAKAVKLAHRAIFSNNKEK